jgi:hypothetical protein
MENVLMMEGKGMEGVDVEENLHTNRITSVY